MIDQRIINDLYDSGIVFDVCCVYGGGFRVRLGSPMTGFAPGWLSTLTPLWWSNCGDGNKRKYPKSGTGGTVLGAE